MASEQPKNFLYLIVSRYEFAMEHLKLQSSRSDVLICTFDKKVAHPKFIYKPTPYWAETRNALVEHARKNLPKYEYYIFRDDDVGLIKGTYEEFEDEVLNIRPDVCTPIYYTNEYVAEQTKAIFFRYSALRHCDCCMVCFSQELFFDKKLLPYHTEFHYTSPVYKRSYYDTLWLWAKLMNDYSDKRILCTSRIWHINKVVSSEEYNTNFRTSMLMRRIYRDKNGGVFFKKMPREGYNAKIADLMYRRGQFAKTLKGKKRRQHIIDNLSNKRRLKYHLYAYYFRKIGSNLQKKRINFSINFIRMLLLGLYRDVKLNLLLWNNAKS